MRYLIIISIAILHVFIPALAQPQPPDTLWTKTYGGVEEDGGRSIDITADGGYIIAGITESYGAGDKDAWVIKTNSTGDTLWTFTYGGSDNDDASCIKQMPDLGYVIVGRTDSYGPGWGDIYLMKTDSIGSEIWTQMYGTADLEHSYWFQATDDEGYIIAGKSGPGYYSMDAYVIKTDSTGNLIWTMIYGGSEDDQVEEILQTADSGYIMVGYTKSYGSGNKDVWLIKTKEDGDTLWTATYGGSGEDRGLGLSSDSDNNYLIVGHTSSFGVGSHDIWLIKVDECGDTLWTQTYGGSGDDRGRDLIVHEDDIYLLGTTESFGAQDRDIILIKTDSNGNQIWQGLYGGYGNELMDWGTTFFERMTNGSFVITGYTTTNSTGDYDVCLICTEPDSIILSCDLSESWLLLTWSAIPTTSAYWIYGAENLPWFLPGVIDPWDFRIDVLPPSENSWESPNGIGNPDSNWIYLVIAVDETESELARSNRAGEWDLEGDIP